ncbi:MAG TPA: ABC transporter permease [Bryobacteraceae bacterium]
MRPVGAWLIRLCGLFRKEHLERELSAEIESNLQLHIEDNLRAGMVPEEARRRALMKLGGVEQAKEAYRDRAWIPWIDSLFRDLRFGARMLRQNRGFTAAVVLSLALGIGASTAVFSILDTVFLRPLPYSDAGRLVWVSIRFPSFNTEFLPSPDYVAWRRDNHVFAQLAATQYGGGGTMILGGSDPAEIRAWSVSYNFPAAFGVRPELGRFFRPQEELPNARRTVLLTDHLWRDHFHANRKIIGDTIELAGQPYTVIGVLPPSFMLPMDVKADVLTTLPVSPTATDHGSAVMTWSAMGRLKPGVTLAQARANVATLFAASKADLSQMFGSDTSPVVEPLREHWVGNSHLLLSAVAAAAACFLLIACANVANLLLARLSTRSHELAIRAAIGAGRGRLSRQLLTEVALLALIGCAGGMAIATVALRGFVHFAASAIPRLDEVAVDGRVFGIAVLVSVLTALLFGVIPALRAGRVDVNAVLQKSARMGLAGRHGMLRRGLIAAEVALSVILLSGAALVLQTLWHLENDHLGFQPEHVLTISLPLRGTKFWNHSKALTQNLLPYLRRIPGTEAAAISECTPLTGGSLFETFTRSDRPLPEPWHRGDNIHVCNTGPDYLKAAGIPVIRGRSFTEQDFHHPGTLAVINQAAVRAYLADGDPIGKRIGGGRWGTWKTVIGIVADTKNHGLNHPAAPQMFVDNEVPDSTSLLFLVRSVADKAALTTVIRGHLHSLDPNLLARFKTLDQDIGRMTTGPRFDSVLFAAFAFVAFLMSVVGIYGVLSFSVAQRTQEIGIRIALGAEPRRVLEMISREGAVLLGVGIAAGLGASLALMRYLKSLLYDVRPNDPATYAAVIICLCIAAGIAIYVPARRASAVEPITALRHE